MKNKSQLARIPTDLARYKTITQYEPRFGDFVIKLGLFSAGFGFVIDYDKSTGNISIAKEGTPRLLVTMNEEELGRNIKIVSIDTVRIQRGWYIQQLNGSEITWYI